MATTTVTQQHQESATGAVSLSLPARMKVDGSDPSYNDWRDDLVRDGFAVIKGAIPKEQVEKYADQMYSLAESL